MKTHHLKTHPNYFERTLNESKFWEIRLNDRDFQTGDEVLLQEYDPIEKQYTGKNIRGIIQYVLHDFKGLKKGYVIFSFKINDFNYNQQ